MIGRLLVVAGSIAAGAAAAAAVWTKRKTELDTEAREAGADAPAMPDAAEGREHGLTPLPPEPETQAAATAEEPEADAGPDDLQSLKGIGAVSTERLAEQGVTTFAQIAAWSDEDLDAMAEAIKVSPERIRREDWVGQARAAGQGPN
jgi:large subunit ribosomal protein L21